MLDFSYYFMSAVAAVIALTVHEYSHAYAAYRLGDGTARSFGRMSLNPLKHIDPYGAICMIFFHVGWAKPVPVNPNAMRNPRNGIIWTSLAGPFSNLIVAFIAFIILRVLGGIPFTSDQSVIFNALSSFSLILMYFITVNIGLAVFNLIPIPPLDGSKVLIQFLPTRAVIWIQRNQMVISIVFMVLVVSGILGVPISFISGKIYDFFFWSTGWIDIIINAVTG
mgnify:CR=1 FL=1